MGVGVSGCYSLLLLWVRACFCVRVFFLLLLQVFLFCCWSGGVLSKRKTPHPHQQQKNTPSHANSKTEHPPAATAKSTLTWIFEPIPLNRHYKCIEQELSFIVEIRCLCPLQCPLPDSCRPGYTGIPKHTPYKALHAAKLESACIKSVASQLHCRRRPGQNQIHASHAARRSSLRDSTTWARLRC